MNSVNSLNSDSDEVRKLSIPNEKKSENVLDTPEEEVSILEHVEKMENLPKKKKSFREKLRYIATNITVEPMLICYIMPSVLSSLATQNLALDKACRVNLNYGTEICDALLSRQTSNYTYEDQMVNEMVARMVGWRGAFISAISCLFIIFLGSWSDRHGRRKPCMLIPFFGEFLTAIGLFLCTYFERLPMEYCGLVEVFFLGFTGSWFTAMMGFFSYIGDITSLEERTLRIGILNLCFSLGVPLGMAFSGVLLRKIGFYGIFSTTASLYLIGLIYGIFFVKEPVFQHKLEPNNKKGLLADVFDKKHVLETFKVAFKKGAHQRRLRVIMLLIVLIVVTGPTHGEMSVMYLFTRFRFNWGEIEFSIFSTYSFITHLFGTMFSVGVFSHLMKIDDAMIGVMSSLSKILSSFVYAFAVENWQIYLGPLVEILNGTSLIAMRSIASKLVGSDELGKINSLFGLAEAITRIMYEPMYTQMYSSTLSILPGAFFLIGSALTAPAVLIFLWMYRTHKRDNIRRALESTPKLSKENK